MIDVQRTFEWLVDGAPGVAPTPMDVLARMCAELVTAGVPIDRAEAFVRTLHPHLAGRSFVWRPGEAVQVSEVTYAYLQSPEFLASPAAEVFQTGRAVRHLLHDTAKAEGTPYLREIRAQGFVDFVALPLRFMSGQSHAITFATRAAGGFADAHIQALEHVLRPLSRIAEILALGRTAINLLNAYVGHNAGERILAGNILRGDTDSLRAVIWFSDLRGFTSLSSTLAAGDIIRTLNELFDCQVPAIERRGGEVLKFMGDGLLAIFPVRGEGRSVDALCDVALEASSEAFDALRSLNERRTRAAEDPMRFGLALHVGDVSYGNIGGSGRLDFTCIGPAVNLAARLEGLTSKLDRRLVVSAEFARHCARPMVSIGQFELKGVSGMQDVFAPAHEGSGGP